MERYHPNDDNRPKTLTKNVMASEEDFGSAVVESSDRVRPSTDEDYEIELDNPDDSISRITYEMERFGLRDVADHNGSGIDVTVRGWGTQLSFPAMRPRRP